MRISELTLKTSDTASLGEFYSGLLGLPVKTTPTGGVEINAGSTSLVFEPDPQTNPFYHFAFNIPYNHVDDARSWLARRVELIWIEDYKNNIAEFRNWRARSVYFYDPAGNIVELIGRADLGEDDQPFHPGQLRGVSEIGIVTSPDRLEPLTAELIQQCNLPYFDKQPPLPQFKAVGDDEGLFIIVPEHRNWYPTAKPSALFPISVQFQHKGHGYKKVF